MKAPLEWLKEYVEINVTTEELCQRMILHGLGVEGVGRTFEEQDGIVVGKLLQIEKHPQADRLQICQVDVGDETVVIVTGAPNVYPGMVCPVARANAVLPGGKQIHPGELRGVMSYGMLCSGGELQLTEEDVAGASVDGILDLGETMAEKLGQPVFGALGLDSEVIDFEISANRGDCMSIIGVAKEISAALGTIFTMPVIHVTEDEKERADQYVSVTIEDSELCPRYTARVIKDIRIAPSPGWMRRRLMGAGVRPINNIVDVTNYVMLEMGCPQHAFDGACVTDGHIIVRRAQENEPLVTLDGKSHVLDTNMLVIADPKGAIGLAGVMGGENSEITDNTKLVILESAKFDGPNNRRTSRALGIMSEAAARYTKGVDTQIVGDAADRAAEFFTELGCGRVLQGKIDTQQEVPAPRVILARPWRINALLGTDIPEEVMVECLEREHLDVELNEAGELVCTVPFARQDLTLEEDIAEEIARVYGYESIPTRETQTVGIGGLNPKQKRKELVRNQLAGYGLHETMSYAFLGARSFDDAGFAPDDTRRNCVRILNPLSEDYALMRTTILPSMMQALAGNMRNKIMDAGLFEISNVHLLKADADGLPEQRCYVCIGQGGDCFYEVKGYLESLLALFGAELRCEAGGPAYYHPGRKAILLLDGKPIGEMGEIHPDVREKLGMEKRAVLAELDLDVLLELSQPAVRYQPLPKYPALERDIALTVAKMTPVGPMMDLIREKGGALLETLTLFDVYEGEQAGEGNKSVAFALTFRADRTLKDEEANALLSDICGALQERFGARLRM